MAYYGKMVYFYYGFNIVILLYYYGNAMVKSWGFETLYHGVIMVLPLYYYGNTIALLW